MQGAGRRAVGTAGAGRLSNVQALLSESERHDRTRSAHPARLASSACPDHRRAAYTLAARSDGGRIVALGWLSVRPYDAPPRRVFLAGTVHPEYRRHGLGRHLLAWQVETARRWQRSCGGDPITIVASSAPLPGCRGDS